MSKKRRKNKGEYKKGAKNLILEVAEEDEELKIYEDEADENDGVPHAQDLSNEPTQTEDVAIAPEAAYSRLTRSDIYYSSFMYSTQTFCSSSSAAQAIEGVVVGKTAAVQKSNKRRRL